MNMRNVFRPVQLSLACVALLWSVGASAEPPSRAARLGYISGTVSFSPVSQDEWVEAVVNRPLTTGDRLWADANSRAELQLGGAAIRLGASSSVTILNLDDRIAQVQLSQGSLKIRVRHLAPEQSFEVDTPNLAFTVRRPGEYRIDVDPNDHATAVSVQNGEAELYGDGASYVVSPLQGYRFYGTSLSDYDTLPSRRDDDFDRWARDRDQRAEASRSAGYVSQEVVGYEDLDANGSWRADPTYGNVWTPSRVPAGWTPYHDGHWAWVDPWGWTWVDEAPWGFAVSHYGRWANLNGTWGWVPGPRTESATYAPALVAFVGGKDFQISVSAGSVVAGAVGWFPLAPREVYQPSYPVSRGYFERINRSNAVIAPTTITNVYNTTNITNTTVINNTTNVVKTVYVNQQVRGAVVAVPAQAFAQSQSVARAAVPLSKEAALAAPVAHAAMIAPVAQSVHGGAPVARAKPPAKETAVVAHTTPPPPSVPFAEQQKHLAANPGKPFDEAQRVQMQRSPARGLQAAVNVVAAAPAPKPTAPPPATAPAPKSAEARKAEAARAANTVGGRPAIDVNSAPARTDSAKVGADHAVAAKVDVTKPDAAKGAESKPDLAKADAAHPGPAKTEPMREDQARGEAARAAARDDAARASAMRAEAARAEAAKAETAKADATRVAQAHADAAKSEAARAKAEIAKEEAAKAQAARAKEEASRADAVRAEEARNAKARADTERAAAAAKAEAAKAQEARAETARHAPAAAHASSPRPVTESKGEEEKKKRAEEEARGR